MEHAGKRQQSLQPRSHTGQESPFCLSYLRWLSGAKVTYFELRLRRHLPGGITDHARGCWGTLAAFVLSGHSPVSQDLFSQSTPSHTSPSEAQGEEETGNYSIRQSGSRFLAPTLKLTEIKTGICCKGTNAAKCHQLLAFCCNCLYPCGFKKLPSSPGILSSAPGILPWSWG